jgi:hypothetical protein
LTHHHCCFLPITFERNARQILQSPEIVGARQACVPLGSSPLHVCIQHQPCYKHTARGCRPKVSQWIITAAAAGQQTGRRTWPAAVASRQQSRWGRCLLHALWKIHRRGRGFLQWQQIQTEPIFMRLEHALTII